MEPITGIGKRLTDAAACVVVVGFLPGTPTKVYTTDVGMPGVTLGKSDMGRRGRPVAATLPSSTGTFSFPTVDHQRRRRTGSGAAVCAQRGISRIRVLVSSVLATSRGFETLVEEVSRNYEQVESRFETAHWIQ